MRCEDGHVLRITWVIRVEACSGSSQMCKDRGDACLREMKSEDVNVGGRELGWEEFEG